MSYALWAARKLAASIGVDPTQCVTLPVITAVPSLSVRNDGPSRWIADTGSGHDLIGGADVSSLLLSNASKVEDAVELHTAKGVTFVDTCVPIQVAKLGEVVSPLLMESCPAVLSVGRRCMEAGYAFHWPAYGSPFFVRPDGASVVM